MAGKRAPHYSAAENTETRFAHYTFLKTKKIGSNIKVGKKQHKNFYASDFRTIKETREQGKPIQNMQRSCLLYGVDSSAILFLLFAFL